MGAGVLSWITMLSEVSHRLFLVVLFEFLKEISVAFLVSSDCYSKIPSLGWLKQTFLTDLEAEKSQIKVPADSVLVQVLSLAGRQLPSPHVLTWPSLGVLSGERERGAGGEEGREGERQWRGSSVGTFIKVTSPIHEAPPSLFNHLEGPPPNTITLDIRFSTYKSGGNPDFQTRANLIFH